MYRLFGRYTLPVHNLQLATVQTNLKQNSQVCSFCSFYHLKPIKSQSCVSVYRKNMPRDCRYTTLRHQSINTNTAFLDERTPKKIKHKMRKYAELLEVSGETTIDKKAKIKKLNAISVTQVANEPEISLDQLHKIRKTNKRSNYEKLGVKTKQDKKQTEYQVSSIIDAQEEMNLMVPFDSLNPDQQTSLPEDELSIEEDFMALGSTDQTTLIKNAAVLNTLDQYPKNAMDESSLDSQATPVIASQMKKERKTKAILKAKRQENAVKLKMEELARQGKQENLKRNLHSYLDVCINCGMVTQALSTLMYYRNRGNNITATKRSPKIVDIVLYNTILHGFASLNNLAKIKEVLHIIAQDSIAPNSQTYAAVFECVGRMKRSQDYKGFLETVLSAMTARGISLNDILDKSIFVYDQREMVNKGIRILDPDFKVKYSPPNTSSDNHLLHKISATVGETITPAKGLFTNSELSKLGQRQIKLESQVQINVKSIAATDEPTPLVLHCREKVIEMEDMWRRVVSEALKRDMTVLKTQHSNGGYLQRSMNVYPYLNVLDEHHYIDAISTEIRQLATGSETFSLSIHILTRQLGQNIFNRYQVEMKKKNGVREKLSQIYEKYCDQYLNEHNVLNGRCIWQNVLHDEKHNGPTADMDVIQWSPSILSSIGRFLYNILIRDIKIDVNAMKIDSKTERYLPAFYTVFRHQQQYIVQEIKPHPILSRIYRDAQLETITFASVLLPSISPPVPWYTVHNGGYMISDAKIIRLSHQGIQQWQKLENLPQHQLYPIFDSLNQLGSIPWRVNNSVLGIALKVFQDGGSKNLDIPEPPPQVSTPTMIDTNVPHEERNRIVKARLQERRKKADMYSLWCQVLYRLSLANHYKDEVFWLPHNMDFRGRVYPIPPHINHLGSDLSRALMVFALGKPLGAHGLDWLKIHIVNLTGLRKTESNSERLKYANEMLPKILDSAENPLNGEKWWQESEEPWQTLAACFEIAEALKSPNPSEYISNFPVHQDGSCNGLQHYAALGRDRQGAESVNLSPSPKPQDVYSSIATIIERERKLDAANDVLIAQVLDGLIKRKIIKQTVMTTVYGVTRFGARLQIARQLKDINFPEEHLWQGSHYLVNKTFHSLREMFTATRLIQDWLTDCARLVALVCSQNMEWVTPLGLPVVQPYNKTVKHKNSTELALRFTGDHFEKPNVMKQKNAFPPNFIHSLDSSHMMLTSLHCQHAGLTFVSVHDCFWTHACTIPAMNKICREQFVALHSEPILENLSKHFVEKFSYKESELLLDESMTGSAKLKVNNILKQVPEQGVFDLKSVLNSTYFFS